MSIHEHPIAMLVWSAGAGSSRMTRAKAVALEAIQALSGTARDALFAYAMTGSAVASLAIIVTSHLEMLYAAPSIAGDEMVLGRLWRLR